MKRLEKVLWFWFGLAMLAIAPPRMAQARPQAEPGPSDRRLRHEISRVFRAAGVALTTVSNLGCSQPTASFDFPSVGPLINGLKRVRLGLVGAGTVRDVTVGGIRVVLGGAGLPGKKAPAPKNGSPGAPVVLGLGDGNLLIAFAGDGGAGVRGTDGTVGPAKNAGNGASGGSCTITCNDHNSIFAVAGYGGNGGNAGSILVGRNVLVPGTNGNGGNGGNSSVSFNQCNVINVLGGDGGADGKTLGGGGAGGNGGNATATSTSTMNAGTVEAGAGQPPGIDGVATPAPGFAVIPPSLDY